MCYEFSSLFERARARALRRQQIREEKRVQPDDARQPAPAPTATPSQVREGREKTPA